MTNANMKLVTVDVPFPENLEMPAQKLDPGEFIQVRIVELAKLRAELQGTTEITSLYSIANGMAFTLRW